MYRFFGMSPPESPSNHLNERDLHPFLSSSLPFDYNQNTINNQNSNPTIHKDTSSLANLSANDLQTQQAQSQPEQQRIIVPSHNIHHMNLMTDGDLFSQSIENVHSDFLVHLSASQQRQQQILSSQLSNMAIDDMSDTHLSPLHHSTSQFSLRHSAEELPIFSMDDVHIDSRSTIHTNNITAVTTAVLGINPMEIYHPPTSTSNARSKSSSLEPLEITSSFSSTTVPAITISNTNKATHNNNINNSMADENDDQILSLTGTNGLKPKYQVQNHTHSRVNSDGRQNRNKTNEIKPLFTKEQLQNLSIDTQGMLNVLSPSSPSFMTSNPIPIPHSTAGTTPTLSSHEQIASFALSPPSPSTPISPSILMSTSPVAIITAQAKQGPDGMFGCVCGKRYSSLMALRNHAKLHGPRERNFICETCKKGFLRKQDLRRHETTHLEGYHPYSCENCGTKFTRSDALSRHVKARRCMRE